MKKTPLETLQKFGLEEREARIYLALLELGKSTILEISRKSGLERTGIYYLLRGLRQRGLIREMYDQKNTLYISPTSPDHLLELESERQQLLKESLPEFKALYNEEPNKPRIQIFEGAEGIQNFYSGIIGKLKHLPIEQREILHFASINEIINLPITNSAAWREERIKYKIIMRIISTDSELAREFQNQDKEQLRESRILAGQKDGYGAAQMIYADTVVQYSVKGEYFVLVTEHSDLANMQKKAFELAWEKAEKYT